MSRGPARPSERGVALLSALLVVALATIMLAMLLDSAEGELARTRNLMRGAQGDQYALGLEAWAIDLLRRDAAEGGGSTGSDDRDEMWAAPLPSTPVPGGTVRGRMHDLNGCLDLNALVDRNGQPVSTKVERLRRLLLTVKLNPDLADAIVDWLDPDFGPSTHGAEDQLYLIANPGYRAANRAFAHLSELRQVRGIDRAAYAALAPHVCALPVTSPPSPLNVNTATVPVLMSLSPAITQAVAERLWQEGHAHFKQRTDFDGELQKLGIVVKEGDLADVGVSSEYFVTQAELEIDGIPFAYSSLIQRTKGRYAVLARMRGAW
jgi:general secretion pathway protein K